MSVKINAKRLVKGLFAGVVPDDFTGIGSGCSRTAYEGPDGKVYKVDNHVRYANQPGFEFDADRSNNTGNLSEWGVYQEWQERGAGSDKFRLAHTELVMVGDIPVLVAEKIPTAGNTWGHQGTRRECERLAKTAVKSAYLWPTDFHNGNWGVVDGCYVVLDYGHWNMAPNINWYEYDEDQATMALLRDGGFVNVAGKYVGGTYFPDAKVMVLH